MFLLPSHVATRKIVEGSPTCDIYTPPTESEQAQLMDGFLRFIEGWLNKIRRPYPNKNWVIKCLHKIYYFYCTIIFIIQYNNKNISHQQKNKKQSLLFTSGQIESIAFQIRLHVILNK